MLWDISYRPVYVTGKVCQRIKKYSPPPDLIPRANLDYPPTYFWTRIINIDPQNFHKKSRATPNGTNAQLVL